VNNLKVEWKNEDLKSELIMNTLEYLGRNQNVSIKDLADYTGQEYILIAFLMQDLENKGIIKSEKIFNLNK
jgi:DNA-binding IscR family transcriptional regulator